MISILIPTYNCAQYLVRSVSSASHQTYDDLQIIIIDDGSTDETPYVAARLAKADSRIHYFRQPNMGVAEARNKAISLADGDFIYFLDADDALAPDTIRSLVSIRHDTGADIVCSDTKITLVSSPDQPLPSPSGSKKVTLYDPLTFTEKVLYQTDRPNNSACGKIIRKSLFDDAPFTPGIIYEDLLLMPQIYLRANKIAWLDSTDYFYTMRPGSITHTLSPKRADAMKVTAQLYDLIAREYPQILRAAADRQLSANFNLYHLIISRDRSADTPELPRQYAEILQTSRQNIMRLRRQSLLNPKVRRKNKLAILATYLGGFPLLSLLSRLSRSFQSR